MNDDRKCGRNADGTFAPGNPGKPPGTRHKATMAALELLGGQAQRLTAKAITMAMAGDTTALKLCLERLIPPCRGRPVQVNLPPVESAADVPRAVAAVLAEVARGELSPEEGAAVAGMIETARKAFELAELEARVAAIEGRLGGGAS